MLSINNKDRDRISCSYKLFKLYLIVPLVNPSTKLICNFKVEAM
jgi:hypothetical protein